MANDVADAMNRLLDREADEDYIAANLRNLNIFPDVPDKPPAAVTGSEG